MSGPPASFSMYTHGPGSNIAPRSASAITVSALGMPKRRQPRALERIDGDVHERRGAVADVLAVVEHRGLVLLALADHDDAVHRHGVEHVPHRVHGGLVGRLLVTAPDQARRRQRGRLGDAHQLERQVAVGCRPLRRFHARRLPFAPVETALYRRLLPDPGETDATTFVQSLELRNSDAARERPYTIANFVASVDGRATIDGQSRKLSDPGDRDLFRSLRERADAVLVGTATLAAENYGRMLPQAERRERRVASGRPPSRSS